MTLRVAFAGTPAFALPPLVALQRAHELVGVLTQPDRPSGRGRILTPGPIKTAATGYGVPVLQPQRLRTDDPELQFVLATLREWRPDVLVVVAYGLILPQSMLNLPPMGALNIHASLLPRWRGAAPIQRALLAGDAVTGISIMQMDAGLDTGHVVLETGLSIREGAIASELHDELAELGASQILLALEGLANGSLKPRPQSNNGVTLAVKLSKAESPVDWKQSAVHLDRQVRAFNPWPVAATTLHGKPVQLLRSRVAKARSSPASASPGTVLGMAGDAMEVACGQGVLQLMQLQRAGRGAVTAHEFLNAERGAGSAPLVFQ
jgi:methionyl-tRNA formyltransferase